MEVRIRLGRGTNGVRSKQVFRYSTNARDWIRTSTRFKPHQAINLARLPISTPGLTSRYVSVLLTTGIVKLTRAITSAAPQANERPTRHTGKSPDPFTPRFGQANWKTLLAREDLFHLFGGLGSKSPTLPR